MGGRGANSIKRITEAKPNNKPLTLNRAYNKTGNMTRDEYVNYKRELDAVSRMGLKRLRLPPDEYAHVMSEINNNMSDEDRKRALVYKTIGNYTYGFVNRGFNDYVIFDKTEVG